MNSDRNTNLTQQEQASQQEQAFEWPRESSRDRNWKQAAQRWAVLRKAYPKHPAVWLQAANAHIEAGELEQADQLLQHAREIFPEHPLTLTESANLAIRQHQMDTADNYLQQARQQHPDFVNTWLRSSEYAETMNNINQASTYAEKACRCAPESTAPFIQYAELAMRNEQWEQALKRWELLRNKYPESPAGYVRAAVAARKLSRHDEARQLLLSHQYGTDIYNTKVNGQKNRQHLNRNTNLNNLLQLIWSKTIFGLRAEVERNYLGYGWWVLEPLLHMAVYYLVFGILLQRGGENFPVFLLTGLIPWTWFMKSVTESSNSIVAGHNLMLQVGLPSVVFPLVKILAATLKQIPIFILLIVFLWFEDFTPNSYWWALAPVIIIQILLTLAFAGFVAALIPFMRDLSYLVPTGLTLLMFLSGIFYDYRVISAEWQEYFLMNPIAFLLKCYREIFVDGTLPDLVALSCWGLAGVTSCFLLLWAYNKLRYIYPRVLME